MELLPLRSLNSAAIAFRSEAIELNWLLYAEDIAASLAVLFVILATESMFEATFSQVVDCS
jgi:hypothetical protein